MSLLLAPAITWNLHGVPGHERLLGRLSHDLAVDHRTGIRRVHHACHVQAIDDTLGRQLAQRGQRGGVFALDARLLGKRDPHCFARGQIRARFADAAHRSDAGTPAARFDDGFVEQPARQRRGHHGEHRAAARGFAKQSYVAGIAAELRDVLRTHCNAAI